MKLVSLGTKPLIVILTVPNGTSMQLVVSSQNYFMQVFKVTLHNNCLKMLFRNTKVWGNFIVTTYITVKHVYKNYCRQKIAQTWCKKHC